MNGVLDDHRVDPDPTNTMPLILPRRPLSNAKKYKNKQNPWDRSTKSLGFDDSKGWTESLTWQSLGWRRVSNLIASNPYIPMDFESTIRRGRALLLSPWSGSISSSQKFSRPENADHSTNIPGQLAIIAFVIVLIVLIIVFAIILYLSRRRRRQHARRQAEEAEREAEARYEESKKKCKHVLVISPGDTIDCAEIQSHQEVEDVCIRIEDVHPDDSQGGSSSRSSTSSSLPAQSDDTVENGSTDSRLDALVQEYRREADLEYQQYFSRDRGPGRV